MQRIIGHINDRLIASRELDKDTYYLEGILSITEELLEVEMEQIAGAFESGVKETFSSTLSPESGLDYYNETFENNEK